MISLLQSIGRLLADIAYSFVSLFKWIPVMLRLTSESFGFSTYLPACVAPLAAVVGFLYVIKVILGAENK